MTSFSHRDRLDRDRNQRRDRAHAHLDRVRRGRGPAAALRRPGWRSALAVGLALLAGTAFGGPLLRGLVGEGARPLARIAVRGTHHLTAAEVALATGVARGAEAASVDEAQVVSRLTAHDWIASAEALVLPGGTLVVEIAERRPAASLAVGETIYAVDERGAPFAPLAADAGALLPRLVAEGPVTPHEPDADLARAVALARRLPELGLPAAAEIRVAAPDDPQGFALKLTHPEARIVLGREDPDARLPDLVRLLAARPEEVAEATEIDLRFANQVVLRSEPARDGSASTAEARGGAPSRTRQPAG
jgi:cell division septal protein FtsQ